MTSAPTRHIYLREIEAGGVDLTIPVDDDRIAAGDVNLDFDSDGRLVGIWVVGARRILPVEVLRTAKL